VINTKYAMREMGINNYKLMRCENYWVARVAYIRELPASVKKDTTTTNRRLKTRKSKPF
jgi:hypothetical protein